MENIENIDYSTLLEQFKMLDNALNGLNISNKDLFEIEAQDLRNKKTTKQLSLEIDKAINSIHNIGVVQENINTIKEYKEGKEDNLKNGYELKHITNNKDIEKIKRRSERIALLTHALELSITSESLEPLTEKMEAMSKRIAKQAKRSEVESQLENDDSNSLDDLSAC